MGWKQSQHGRGCALIKLYAKSKDKKKEALHTAWDGAVLGCDVHSLKPSVLSRVRAKRLANRMLIEEKKH